MISTKALLTHPQGLSGLLAEVLQFIPQQCSLLLEVTTSGVAGVRGYDFLVNAVWPVVVDVIDRKASVIFAPGNPDTFHKVGKYIHLNLYNSVKSTCMYILWLFYGSYGAESASYGLAEKREQLA